MNRLTYEQLIEIDGILHEPLSSQQKQLRELEDLFNSILASQRQAILKEVREGSVDVYWDEHNGELVQAVPIAYLDAMEKKV